MTLHQTVSLKHTCGQRTLHCLMCLLSQTPLPLLYFLQLTFLNKSNCRAKQRLTDTSVDNTGQKYKLTPTTVKPHQSTCWLTLTSWFTILMLAYIYTRLSTTWLTLTSWFTFTLISPNVGQHLHYHRTCWLTFTHTPVYRWAEIYT